ncbi:helix-turn-helix domain-containing protein [Streptomyces sp. NPDC048290]|uniref:helix-turn-helix domain-containing protein n=1 Tax=Streptomyces sp. NPDC048290 TaxID=3155811 RepID=UPI00342D6129
MPNLGDDHTGSRIREQRRLARLSQRELADRIPYSYSLLNQVECGARPATDEFVAAVARALNIDADLLTGRSQVTDVQGTRLAELVRPIREALDLYDLGPNPDLTVRPAAVLIAEADRLCAEVRATRLRNSARMLPSLIAELTHTAWDTPSTAVWQALASAYRTAHDITLKLGHSDLSSTALDRMAWAAGRASDPCLAAIRQYKRALVYYREGEQTIGQRLIASGHHMIEQADAGRDALVVTGQLHLGGAVICGRAGDKAAVARHIAEARGIAKRTGDASQVHWLSFGPTNVALHHLSATMKLRDYDKALTQARAVQLPPRFATSRRAGFLIDRARVEMETGHTQAALDHLLEARRVAPEQTRYHGSARETIRGLVHMSRRTPDALNRMAAWIGL